MQVLFQTSLLLLLLLSRATCRQSPPHYHHEQIHLSGTDYAATTSSHESQIKRVAIIGAGSAGTSVAYYLSQYAGVDITIFERNSYIGGRSTTVNAYQDASEPVELGASIFVEVNRNLVQAAKDLNLSTNALRSHNNIPATIGIYDGVGFVYTAGLSGTSYWDLAKLFWRYGLAPYRAQKVMKRVVGQFLTMYDAPVFPFKSLSQAAYDVGLTAVTAATGAQYLRENEVADLFSNEIVQAATRVNYAQNLDSIHGLEALVCLAADNARSVEGGNWRIFDRMAKASGARTLLGTNVYTVTSNNGTYTIMHGKGGRGAGAFKQEVFDEVVLAAPYHQTGISFEPKPKHIPDDIPYKRLEVTLFTSASFLSPLFFGLDAKDVAPDVVLTTLPPKSSNATETTFYSISTLRTVQNPQNGAQEYLYKIFSPEPLDNVFLSALLGGDAKEVITWKHTKSWLSYPLLPPRITFEHLKLDKGLWYTSGIESFISTMETSSLMGNNIARLMANSWKG